MRASFRWGRRNKNISGFTLIEISMVIVIIGIILTGIFTGQDIVRHAKLQNVISDFQSYGTAVQSFRLKYNGIPGDINDFSTYFTACANSVANDCDGNGNRIIAINDEDYVAWEHLWLAGFIDANMSRVAAYTIGTNMPESAISSVGYWFAGDSNGALYVTIGSKRGDDVYINGEAFRPDEAKSIDDKIDDGAPQKGIYRTYRDQERWNTAGICIDKKSDDSDLADAVYILSDTSVTCYGLYYINK
ncbi:type II secretion system GspH family protein [Rickettsiales bacterium]|nr:type II secretion system GspH family protein [Rickettsiales bacterium]